MSRRLGRRRSTVYVIASEHVYNMSNIGLNIHSDMLCDITKARKGA